jgi:hypothetical protein
MADDPRSFWGKVAVLIAFISALVGLGAALKECSFPSVPGVPSLDRGRTLQSEPGPPGGRL